MKKIKEFMATPMTWGGYTKMCIGCYLASCAIAGAIWGKLYYDIKKRDKELEEIESEDEDNYIEFGR